MVAENLVNASVSVSVLWAKHMFNQCSGQNLMTVHFVYETILLSLHVFSMSFKACHNEQTSPLFYYSSVHIQCRWTEHAHVDNFHAEPLTALLCVCMARFW